MRENFSGIDRCFCTQCLRFLPDIHSAYRFPVRVPKPRPALILCFDRLLSDFTIKIVLVLDLQETIASPFRTASAVMDCNSLTRITVPQMVCRTSISRLLFLPGLRTFPKIRTVAQGAKELHDAGTGLNERHIRAFIRSDTLRTIEIGNRRYIALQSFESPYSSRLFGCIREKKTDGLRYRNTADDQIERIRAEHAKPPFIRRVR